MRRFHPVIWGTLVLTASGVLCRCIGFFYRIFLSNTIGEEGMGLYQLSFSAAAVCTALCCTGFQTAISRLTATAKKQPKEEHQLLGAGLLLTMGISITVTVIFYRFAELIATELLMEPRCTTLLQIYALSLPFSAMHNCFNGYYLGKQKALLPALFQLAEQSIRITSILILWQIALDKGRSLTPVDAMAGLFISELFVVLLLIPYYFAKKTPGAGAYITKYTFFSSCKSICLLAVPLIANRLVLTLLQSLETILIPGQLRAFGLSDSDALRIYGVFTGMALPFIMFPSSLTGSAATMAMPAIAGAQSEDNSRQVLRISHGNIYFSLWLGIFAAGLFVLYGLPIGTAVFQSETAGTYLQRLSILCPFLYLSMTLSSIINGLGKPEVIFFHTITGLLLRLLSVIFLIPTLGMEGYFTGTLLSQVTICLLHYHYLKKHIHLPFYLRQYLLSPLLYTLVAGGISLGCYVWISPLLPELFSLLLSAGMMAAIAGGFGLLSFRKKRKNTIVFPEKKSYTDYK